MGGKGSKKKRPEEERKRDFKVRPFEELKSLKKQLKAAPPKETPPPPTPLPAPAPAPAPTTREDLEADAFAKAMNGVAPLNNRERVARTKTTERRPSRQTMDEAAAVDAYLRDLVDGVAPFDIADTDEYIEGAIQGFDRKVLRRLRKGDFALQGHIDLHGFTREEARSAVAKFLKDANDQGKRCVLIVHGRGLRSKGQIPVLKEKLKAWLTRGSIGTKVLAFSSARPYDGGTGAVYVLLRR